MMNIIDIQNKMKGFSEEQLVQEMQAPSGQIPQFLILNEITRRKKMRDSFDQERGRDQTTVAEDVVAAAGMPAGFAGQMAGALAPQTDVQGNTAAMPQQGGLPEPTQGVVGMAGGGIVALQTGGRVQGPPQMPRRVVRDGIIYLVDEQGRETAWGPATDQSFEPVNPSYGREGIYQQPRDMRAAPSIVNVPALPSDMLPPVFSYPSRLPEMGTPDIRSAGVQQQGRPLGSPVERPPVQQMDPNVALRAEEDAMPARGLGGLFGPSGGHMESQLNPLSRTPLSGSNFGAEVPEQAPVLRGQRYTPEVRNRIGLFFDRLRAGAPMDPNSPEFQQFAQEFPEEAAAALAQDADLRSRIAEREAFARGETSFVGTAAEQAAAEQAAAEQAAAEQAAAEQAAAEQAAATRTAPTGGGIAAIGQSGAPTSSYEQELLDMMERREKRAEQDKWLALAQFGAALMASSSPTFGGALGEAGMSAIGPLRESRESAEADRLGMLGAIEQHRMSQAQLELQRQAAAARSAGSGWPGLLTPLQELQSAEREVSAAVEAFEAARMSGNRAAEVDADNALKSARARYEQIRNTLSVFAGSTAASDSGPLAPSARGI